MKNPLPIMAMVVLAAWPARAEQIAETAFADLAPFDQLNRANVRIRVEPAPTVSDANGHPSRIYKLTITAPESENTPVLVQLYIQTKIKNSLTAKRLNASTLVNFCGEETLPHGDGATTMQAAANHAQKFAGDYRLSLDWALRSGDSPVGWLVRVIRAGGIVGVEASDPSLLEMAKNPARLQAEYLPEQMVKK